MSREHKICIKLLHTARRKDISNIDRNKVDTHF